MAISINDTNKPAVNTTGQVTPINKQQKQSSADTAAVSSEDTVALTDTARLVQQLEQRVREIPVVDSSRVAEVRENLNSGNYEISSQRIAEKFTRYESFLQQAS